MRILFLNYEYPPLGGGAANATSYILREFSKIADLEVDLVTSSHDKNFHLEKLGNNIRIHRLPIGKNEKNLHFQSKGDLLAYSRKAFFYSRKLIKKNSYDLSHSFFSVPCGFLSLLFKWQYKIPYIISLRGADVPGYSERFSSIYNILKPVIKIIWKKADFVVSNSEGLKELACKTNPGQKIEVIYNGIDTDQFRPKENQDKTDTFRILCVSRLTARKGIRYLIKAFSLLKDKYSNIKLEIVGEGDEKNNLENLAKELKLESKVYFSGLINHEKLPEIYQGSQVFVLPSLNEGMSNTMLEALASGLPVIATDTGGTKELISDGENGFIVEMKSSQDIAEKLERLIKDEELRKKMSWVSRKIAEKLNWKKVADAYYDLYKKIL